MLLKKDFEGELRNLDSKICLPGFYRFKFQFHSFFAQTFSTVSTRSRLRRAIKLGLARERIRYQSSQAVNLLGRVVEHLALLRDAEVRDHLKIGGVKLLNAAGQLADWQVAREHAAVWTEKLDGIEDPRSDLCDRPADAEDAFHPKDLNRDVVTGDRNREVPLA